MKCSTRPLTSFLKGRCIPETSNHNKAKNFLLYDPSTNKVRQSVQPATSSQIQEAIKTSAVAQRHWYNDYTPSDRAHILNKASTLLRERSEEIATLESTETGRVISETSTYDVPTACNSLHYHASLLTSSAIQNFSETIDSSLVYSHRQPLGVTVGLGAWNYPLVNAIAKSAPALAFGNSMLFKPSELTPSTTLELAHIYHEAGVPEGVFQVLLGGGDVGKQLVNDGSGIVQKVSMTGSVDTGRKVYQAAAKNLNSVTLELGGKSPLILWDDCDIKQAVVAAMVANWYSNGQVCSNGTRVFVHSSIQEEFVAQLVLQTKNLIIGNPLNPMTNVGPMVSQNHMEKVLEYIHIGKEVDKATLVYGGERHNLDEGNYLQPAIFIDCTDNMRIVQEEVFGMLLSVLTFESEEEVIQRANATSFGLAAGIFTQDVTRAHRFAKRLEAGTVWINNYNVGPVEVPWSGWKNSGVGLENGFLGAQTWTKVKSVHVEIGEIANPFQNSKMPH